MEIQPTTPTTPSTSGLKARPAETSQVDHSRVRLNFGEGQEAQDYRLKLLGDLDSLGELALPELKTRVGNSDLKGALNFYSQAETVPERRIWESRLQELSRRNTRLARAESTTDTSEKKEESSWADDMKPVGRPREDYSIGSLDELLKVLKIGKDSEQAKTLRNLITNLSQHGGGGSRVFGHLREIASDHGLKKLISVCSTLNRYMTEQGDKEGPVDIGDLVRCALKDLAHPNGINQDGKGTCAAASIMCKLAAERPEQYVEMLTTLASGKAYTAPGGQVIEPNESWVGDKSDRRRVSEKIMQNAIMDQRGRPYDSQKDLTRKSDDEEGMYDSEIEDAAERVFGFRDRDFDMDSEGLLTSKRDMWAYIQDDLARGRPVSVTFKGHAVLVTGFDPTQNPPQVLIATWGKSYTMDLDKFLRHVVAVRSQDDSGLDNKKLPTDRKTSVLDDAA